MILVHSVSRSYYLYRYPTDMRKGFYGLGGLVRNTLGRNPTSGDVFLFLNRNRNLLKALFWEGDGYAIYYKRLEQGTYELPTFQGDSMRLDNDELHLFLSGIELSSARRRKRFGRKKKS